MKITWALNRLDERYPVKRLAWNDGVYIFQVNEEASGVARVYFDQVGKLDEKRRIERWIPTMEDLRAQDWHHETRVKQNLKGEPR